MHFFNGWLKYERLVEGKTLGLLNHVWDTWLRRGTMNSRSLRNLGPISASAYRGLHVETLLEAGSEQVLEGVVDGNEAMEHTRTRDWIPFFFV